MKLAKLKTIFRDSKSIDVVSDKLDDNSVSTINIVDQSVTADKIKDSNITTDKIANSSVTAEKVEDECLTFDKMTDSTKFITTDSSIVALASCGGIKVDDDIANKSIRDLLKEIILPYTPPSLDFRFVVLHDSNGVDTGYSSTINLNTGSSVYLAKIRALAMIRSDAISKLVLNIILNDNIVEQYTITDLGTFQAKTWKDVSINQINKSIKLTNICDTLKLQLQLYDAVGGYTTKEKYIYARPHIYYGNSNLSVTVNASKQITSNIDELFTKSSEFIYNYDTDTSIQLQYNLPTQEYSYILLPGNTVTINTFTDQNNFTQTIEYVGSITRNINDVNVNYKLFRTGVSTMTSTNPIYTFKVVKE